MSSSSDWWKGITIAACVLGAVAVLSCCLFCCIIQAMKINAQAGSNVFTQVAIKQAQAAKRAFNSMTGSRRRGRSNDEDALLDDFDDEDDE